MNNNASQNGNNSSQNIPYFNPTVPPPSIAPNFFYPPPSNVPLVPSIAASGIATTKTRKRPSRFSDAPKPVIISVPPPPARFYEEQKRIERRARLENESEREKILRKWRSNYCETSEQMTKKLAELAESEEKQFWVRSSPADVYYKRTHNNIEVQATPRLEALCELFERELLVRAQTARAEMPKYTPPPRKERRRLCKHKSEVCSSSDDSDEEFHPEQDCSMEELSMKTQHPHRLHADLWHNEAGEMNDGPLCR